MSPDPVEREKMERQAAFDRMKAMKKAREKEVSSESHRVGTAARQFERSLCLGEIKALSVEDLTRMSGMIDEIAALGEEWGKMVDRARAAFREHLSGGAQ